MGNNRDKLFIDILSIISFVLGMMWLAPFIFISSGKMFEFALVVLISGIIALILGGISIWERKNLDSRIDNGKKLSVNGLLELGAIFGIGFGLLEAWWALAILASAFLV